MDKAAVWQFYIYSSRETMNFIVIPALPARRKVLREP